MPDPAPPPGENARGPRHGAAPDEGLPRAQRVRRHNDFTKIERTGARAHGALVTVVHVTRRDGRARVGFTVSKKVSLKAVVRNRVRRRLKEIVRRHKEWLARRDVILIAKPESATRSSAELAADLSATFAAIDRSSEKHREQTPPARK